VNLSAKAFDLDNARACARASADAYRQETICGSATDTHCLIGEAPDCLIIAFRGTNSIRNWVTDAEFERTILVSGVDGTCSKIHKGFEAALNSVIEQLINRLGGCSRFVYQNCKPLFITGHSLGGALAILAALELQRNGLPIAQVYTFGQPRVGNGDFKRRYEASLGDRTFRVVYEEDIVARIPHFPGWRDPYRHVGMEVFLPAFGIGEMVINPSLWYLLASDAWGIYRAWCISKFAGALDPIHDHHVGNYVSALAGIPNPPTDIFKNKGGGSPATERTSAEPTAAPAHSSPTSDIRPPTSSAL